MQRHWDEIGLDPFKELKEGPVCLNHREHSCTKEIPRREIILHGYISTNQKFSFF